MPLLGYLKLKNKTDTLVVFNKSRGTCHIWALCAITAILMFDSFGNKVRIKSSTETEEKQLAGKIGEVYGQTTPSIMDLEIVGNPKEDFAVNVFFEDLDESFWFDSELLEHIEDGEGTVITLDGIDKKWTKGKDGQWIEENTPENKDQNLKTERTPESKTFKKWWNFWS